jgi:hypothetical protein
VVEIMRKRRAQIESLEVTVEGAQQEDPPWTYRRVTLHYRVVSEGLSLPVLARVIRLSIVRYCSVISTIAGTAAIAATVELVGTDGSTSDRQPVELALPATAPAGALEPIADEHDPPATALT